MNYRNLLALQYFFSTDTPLIPIGFCIRFRFLLLRCFLKPKRRCCPAEKSVYEHIFIMKGNNKVSFCLCGHHSIIWHLYKAHMNCDSIETLNRAKSEAFKQTIVRQERCVACVCGQFKISGESRQDPLPHLHTSKLTSSQLLHI